MKKFSYKYIAICGALAAGLWSAAPCQAVDVGDVFYSDGTFSSTITEDANKLPIGLVYWVSISKDSGLIMSLKQPADMNYTDAVKHCDNYEVLGTTPGSWRLPDLPEQINMGLEIWNGVSNDKFNVLNNRLGKISIAQKLLTGQYHSNTTGSAGTSVDLSTGLIQTEAGTSSGTKHVRCIRVFKAK